MNIEKNDSFEKLSSELDQEVINKDQTEDYSNQLIEQKDLNNQNSIQDFKQQNQSDLVDSQQKKFQEKSQKEEGRASTQNQQNQMGQTSNTPFEKENDILSLLEQEKDEKRKCVLRRILEIRKILQENESSEQLLDYFKTRHQVYNNEILNWRVLNESQFLKLKKYKQSIYFGEMQNGKRIGKGVMLYYNGRIYEGDWQNDYKFGRGYELYPNGNRYEGYFVNGKNEGKGSYVWFNGEIYDGQWMGGMKHGLGMWKGHKGDSYTGEWKFGKADGYGVHVWINGDRYEGQFKACLKHGEGTEKFANGDYYTGYYINGRPEGEGEYLWKNGSVYKGQFKNGLRHGKGTWMRNTVAPCDRYEGEYQNDKKCGQGVFQWQSGNTYHGEYFDDLRHGFGVMEWVDGSYYKGNWERGIQSGEGELYVPNEQIRKGQFVDNVFMGEEESQEGGEDKMRSSQIESDKENSCQIEQSFQDFKRNLNIDSFSGNAVSHFEAQINQKSVQNRSSSQSQGQNNNLVMEKGSGPFQKITLDQITPKLMPSTTQSVQNNKNTSNPYFKTQNANVLLKEQQLKEFLYLQDQGKPLYSEPDTGKQVSTKRSLPVPIRTFTKQRERKHSQQQAQIYPYQGNHHLHIQNQTSHQQQMQDQFLLMTQQNYDTPNNLVNNGQANVYQRIQLKGRNNQNQNQGKKVNRSYDMSQIDFQFLQQQQLQQQQQFMMGYNVNLYDPRIGSENGNNYYQNQGYNVPLNNIYNNNKSFDGGNSVQTPVSAESSQYSNLYKTNNNRQPQNGVKQIIYKQKQQQCQTEVNDPESDNWSSSQNNFNQYKSGNKKSSTKEKRSISVQENQIQTNENYQRQQSITKETQTTQINFFENTKNSVNQFSATNKTLKNHNQPQQQTIKIKSYSLNRNERTPSPRFYEKNLNKKIPNLNEGLKKYEILLWEKKKNSLKININNFKNLNDPHTIQEIRKIIYPPVWKPAGSVKNFTNSSPLSPRDPFNHLNNTNKSPIALQTNNQIYMPKLD